ncbi:MAG: pseudouridine synthase, partial [Chloroflexota bacterium]
MYIPLIYQDDDLIVVNKPAGLKVHSDEGEGLRSSPDLVTLLKRQLDCSYLGLHHRLDREVSGVMVLAARPEANTRLAKAFEERQVQKEYLALVANHPPKKAGVIDAPLVARPDGRWQVAAPSAKGAKSAVTRYRVEAQGRGYSLLRLSLETGRTHQLRVHLAHLGCPIIGDPLYGLEKGAALPKFPRLMLHAVRLVLPGPGEASFEAPLPPLFERAKAGSPLPELSLAVRLTTASLSTLEPGERAGLHGLLELAQERRAPLADDPTLENTTYRLINAAADGLPGITLDRYGSALVLNCYDPVLEVE